MHFKHNFKKVENWSDLLRHTDYNKSHSDTKTTPILTQLHRLLSFLLIHKDYSIFSQTLSYLEIQTTSMLYSDTHTTTNHTQTNLILTQTWDTQTTLIEFCYSMRGPLHSNAVQALAGGPISALKTQTQTHKLLSFYIDYSHFTQTHRLLPLSH